MSRLILLLLFMSLCLPALAQQPKLPDKPANEETENELIKGRISSKAPKCAKACTDMLKTVVQSEAEFYASDYGALSVHMGISAKRLRFIAKKLEKIPGIRQALTDTPRRMILLIFQSAPATTGPDAIAGGLETMRRRYKNSLKARAALLGSAGDSKEADKKTGNGVKSGKSATKTKNKGAKNSKGLKKTSKKARKATPSKKIRFYSFYHTPITDEIVANTKITGPVTSARALKLWLDAKDRPQAVAVARKIFAKHPKDVRIGAVLAMYHLHRGHSKKAYQNMRTVLHYQPQVALYHAMYAEVLYAMNLNSRAKEEEQKAKKLGFNKNN